jgi:polyisoprenoid-binding protein YceI
MSTPRRRTHDSPRATLAGFVKTPGRFRELSGSLMIEQAGANGVVTIDAGSIDTGNGMRDPHLRTPDFFHVSDHPELRYELHTLAPAGQDRLHLDGQLTVAGTQTALPLDAELRIHTDTLVEISGRTPALLSRRRIRELRSSRR